MRSANSIFLILCATILHGSFGQCPIAGFTVGSNVCLEEQVTLTNTSVSTSSYFWDFCVGDYLVTPSAQIIDTNTDLSNLREIETIYMEGDGIYVFTVGESGELYRYHYANDFGDTPTETNLGNVDGTFSTPRGLGYIEEGGNHYMLVANAGDGTVSRVTFGGSLGDTPSASTISGLSDLSGLRGLEVLQAGDSILAYVVGVEASNASLSLLDFGSSVLNTPDQSTFAVSGASLISDISFVQDCDLWYGITGSYSNNRVLKLFFGDDLSTLDSVQQVTGVSRPFGVDLRWESGEYYGFATSESGNFYRVDFGDFTTSGTETVNNMGDLGILGLSVALDVLETPASETYGLVSGYNTERITLLTFTDACSSPPESSIEETPSVSYAESGTFDVQLTAYDAAGRISRTVEQVTVSASTAPDISIGVDTDRCISLMNEFTSVNISGDITSYAWDFDGDEVVDSTDPNPSYQYLSSGTYTVRLDVTSSSGCTNFATEELTIYDELPVQGDYFSYSGFLCSNASIDFTNETDSSGFEGLISYSWNFDGESTSTETDPSYSFLTSGTKRVTLTISLPGTGCTDQVYWEDLDVVDGPTASFSYLNNCFGDTIQFTNGSSGANIVSYAWDFGDGMGSSSSADTLYKYGTAGTYTVRMTVANGSGCETVYSDDLEVNDGDLVSFDVSGSVENFPIDFVGNDLTLDKDSVTSWSWDFGGEGMSVEEDPTFVFGSPGTYLVGLDVETAQGCPDTVTEIVTIDASTCPTPAFTVSASSCIGEQLTISNTSLNAESYVWDFCVGDYLSTPTASDLDTLSGVSNIREIETIYLEGEGIYVFVVGESNELYRYHYANGFTDTPTETNLGNVDNRLSTPRGLGYLKEAGNHYLLVGNSGDGSLSLLSFGSDLSNIPTAVTLSGLSDLSGLRGLEVLQTGDSLLAYVVGVDASNASLSILDFGSSVLNTPDQSTFAVSGASLISDISFVQDCDLWYGITGSYSNNRLLKLFFGNDLSTLDSVHQVTGVSRPFGVDLRWESGKYYGFATSESGNFYRIDLEDFVTSGIETVNNLGNLGTLGLSVALDVLETPASEAYGLVSGYNTERITLLTFTDACSSPPESSIEETPSVSYAESGTFDVQLTAYDAAGRISRTVEQVTVTSSTAPPISFTASDSRCILNANTFAATPSTGLSYSWDFNGEGSANSSFETFQFPTTGEKRVVLTVSDGICTNQAVEVFDIYPQPPDPIFAFDEAQYCAEVDFAVNNTTDDVAFNGNLTYQWIVQADSDFVFEGADPAFNVAPIGTFNVTAQTSVPGCESNVTNGTVTIEASPETSFSVSPTCDGEVTTFTNFTVGSISQQWDFGNNFTSTQFAPDHFYDSVGTYAISLTAVNDLGCARTVTDSLTVGSLPIPGFLVTQGCEGVVALEDTSTVVGADIAVWEWTFENELFSSAQNPIQEVLEPGTYLVRQKVISSVGCEAELLQPITVFDAAEIAFESAGACDGDPFTFTDVSTTLSNNPIIGRSWNINGTRYEEEQIQHTFPAPGRYLATLTLTTQNLCSVSETQAITVFDIPTLDFSTPSGCQNEFLTIDDLSIPGNDSLISRSWFLNGQLIGTGATLLHRFENDGANQVTLSTVTSQGCIYEHTEGIIIFPAATADFESATTFGILGSQIAFDNTSTLGASFIWTVDGDSVANSQNFNYRFDDSGDYDIALIAVSDFSCADTVNQDIRIRVPQVDLVINEVLLQEQDEDFSNIIVSLENRSNLPVDLLSFTLTIDDQLPTRDRVQEVVEINQSRVFQLSTSIPNRATYVCLEVASGYAVADDTPDNNEVCINIEPKVIFEDPFPNPARSETIVRTIIPESGTVHLTLTDLSGKTELMESYNDLPPGLQAFTIPLQHLEAGMYILKIDYNGQIDTKRIIKH